MNITGIYTLCIRCWDSNASNIVPARHTYWVTPCNGLLTDETSNNGSEKVVGDTLVITNPKDKIKDGYKPYELYCVGGNIYWAEIDLFTTSKYCM